MVDGGMHVVREGGGGAVQPLGRCAESSRRICQQHLQLGCIAAEAAVLALDGAQSLEGGRGEGGVIYYCMFTLHGPGLCE